MKYSEQKLDLTTIRTQECVVAHCIAADLSWGGGIAPIIIRKMYDSENACRYKCSTNPSGFTGDLKSGDIMVINASKGTFINLITKTHSWDKPTYQDFTETLVKLRNYMQDVGYKKLTMPKIGCGLDRLEWSVVSQIIRGVFCDTDIEITIACWP